MSKDNSDEMRDEYRLEELGAGVRGKHFAAWREGTNLVLLEPDIAKAFPSAESVNNALRCLLQAAHRSVKKTENRKRGAKKVTPGRRSAIRS